MREFSDFREGAAVRSRTSHQRDSGSYHSFNRGLSLLLVLILASRVSNFQFDLESEGHMIVHRKTLLS